MNAADRMVFLLEVDNTLLDSDRFKQDLSARLEQDFGSAGRQQFWALHAALQERLGYVDPLGTVQAFRAGRDGDPALPQLSAFLLDYPFAQRLFPRALHVIAHLGAFGLPVVLTSGDMVYQPHKVKRSGIWDAVAGRVLIAQHKRHALDLVQQRYPAAHYVMVDDQPSLLSAMKRVMGSRLTTVFAGQGHRHTESEECAPDISIERIDALLDFGSSQFRPEAPGGFSLPSRSVQDVVSRQSAEQFST